MLKQLHNAIVTPVSAACDPSQGGLNLKDCLLLNPDNPNQTVADVYSNPASLVNIIVRNVFVLAGLVLFFMIIFAGFKFTMQPGSKGKEDAKNIAQSVAIGFMVMFSAYWIIQLIEVITDIPNII